MRSFHGKTAVVTGAASGLGRSLCQAIAGEGARVVAVDVNPEGLESTARAVRENGRDCVTFQADVSSAEEMGGLASMVRERYGAVDLLVCAAGVGIGGRVHEFDLEYWELAMGVNLWGNIYALNLFLPGMVKRRQGHIVSIASGGGLFAIPNAAPYISAKYALVGLYEAAGIELEKYGIKVTVACPTWMNTGFFKNSKVKATVESDRLRLKAVGWCYEHLAMGPEKAAAKVMKGIKRDRPLVLIGKETYATYYIKRFSHTLYRTIMKAAARFF